VSVFNLKSTLDGRISRAQINDMHGIPEPPRLSTFKRRGGGGLESGVHLFNGRDHDAQINGARGDSGPPPNLSTFKRRGGGSGIRRTSFRRPRSARPDQRRSAISSFSAALSFSQCGPLFCPCGIFPHLTIHSSSAMCPTPFHVSLPPLKASPLYLISCSLRLLSSAMCLPLSSLSCLITSYHALMVLVPPLPLCTPSLALASPPIHQAIQLIQVAARRVFHVAKVPSWPGHPQSQ
jgi:hypothetical protein